MKNLLLTCLLFIVSLNAAAFPEVLPVDKAFQISAEPLDQERVRLTWKVTDGYYLYRKKFALRSTDPNIQIPAADTLTFPKGEVKADPNFGEMEIYHKDGSVEIPLTRLKEAQQATELQLESKFQGCADAGLCYPPQTKLFKVQLAALDNESVATPKQAEPSASDPEAEASEQMDSATEPEPVNDPAVEPLTTEEAFKYSLVALDQKTLVAHWEIQDDYQLYRSKINFSVKGAEHVQLGAPLFPAGTIVEDDYFGTLEVFSNTLDISLPLVYTDNQTQPPKKLSITTEYQGCSNSTGICYPPVKKTVDLDLSTVPPKLDQPPTENDANEINAADSAYANALEGAGFFGTIALFFGGGLLLAFTPCIFPMFPILSGVIAGQSDLSARKAFFLSLAYVVASSTAYALIGIFFGLFGANLQMTLQHPVAIGIFATLFVILALSMFGFFDLQLPSSLQSRLNEFSNRQQSGSLVGAAIMGFISTLIVGPCVAPPLAGALTYIAQSKDALLGGIALFTMGFAMGIPLLIVGTSAGHLLPRAGTWMDTTKAIFGMIMLGLAISMLKRIIPIEVTMALTGTLLVASGTYMGALDKLSEEATGWKRFWKSIGLIMVFYGAMQLFGVATGSTNLFQPLKGIFTATSSIQTTNSLNYQSIKTLKDLEAKLRLAKERQQTTMLDFTASWCTECERLEKTTFSDANVIKGLQNVQLLKVDISDDNESNREILKKFTLSLPPIVLFFDKNGNEIKNIRAVGYKDANDFLKRLKVLNSR